MLGTIPQRLRKHTIRGSSGRPLLRTGHPGAEHRALRAHSCAPRSRSGVGQVRRAACVGGSVLGRGVAVGGRVATVGPAPRAGSAHLFTGVLGRSYRRRSLCPEHRSASAFRAVRIVLPSDKRPMCGALVCAQRIVVGSSSLVGGRYSREVAGRVKKRPVAFGVRDLARARR
jgi:hypothetical protein